MKIRLSTLSGPSGLSFAKLVELAAAKLPPEAITGSGKNLWIDSEDGERLVIAAKVPPAVPDRLTVPVVKQCPNPNWVWALINGTKTPVAIPSKLRGKLIGKTIPVHAITDASGTTYRHADLTGHHHKS